MKAKFVFENIDFERGRDAKKALGLGIPYLVRELPNMIFEEDKKNQFHVKYESGKISPLNIKGGVIGIYYEPSEGERHVEGAEISRVIFKFYLAHYCNESGVDLDQEDYIAQ